MAKYKAISYDDIESLAARAITDDDALKELGRLNSKYGRAANQRMRELEKRGLETGAYIRARDALNKAKPRFSQAKKGEAEELVKSLEETVKFLNYQTSSVTGEMERRENIIKGMERAGYSIGDSKKDFLDFLDSDAWNEVRAMFGSKEAMRQVSDAIDAGKDIAELTEAFKAFQKGQSESEDILQVWDNWANEND